MKCEHVACTSPAASTSAYCILCRTWEEGGRVGICAGCAKWEKYACPRLECRLQAGHPGLCQSANGTVLHSSTPAGRVEKDQGRKDDGGKDPWHLLPWQAVRQIVHVLEFGRKKYGANNWQGVENSRERYFSAAIRHLTAWYSGEDKDAESGIHHLAHAGCCVVFLLWFEINNQSKI